MVKDTSDKIYKLSDKNCKVKIISTYTDENRIEWAKAQLLDFVGFDFIIDVKVDYLKPLE